MEGIRSTRKRIQGDAGVPLSGLVTFTHTDNEREMLTPKWKEIWI